MKYLLQNTDIKADDLEAVKKTKLFYKSCLDAADDYWIQPTRDLLHDLIGGMPMSTPDWDEDKFDLTQVLIKLTAIGLQPFFTLIIEEEESLSYQQVIQISTILDFKFDKMTLLEFHRNYSQVVDWRSYFTTIMATPGVDITDVTDDEPIINYAPLYLRALRDLLNKTSKRTIANYLGWRVVDTLTREDITPFLNQPSALKPGKRSRLSDHPHRYDHCYLTSLNSRASRVMDRMYVNKYWNSSGVDLIPKVKELVSQVKNGYKKRLDALDWLDNKTREVAKEKIDYVEAYVGFDPQLLNDRYVEEQMAGIEILADDYFGNLIRMKNSTSHALLRKLRTPPKQEDWDLGLIRADMWYYTDRNAFYVPLSHFLKELICDDCPSYINLAALGSYIGHEMTHALDTYGRLLDEEGYRFDWWDPLTSQKFENRIQCFVDQFSQFSFEPGDPLTGTLGVKAAKAWLDEIISDNGAISVIYQTYKDLGEDKHAAQFLPGLNYTRDQLFFITIAQHWCQQLQDFEFRFYLEGRHPFDRYRILGMMQNSEEFQKAFNCKPDQFMNPPRKCLVW